MIRDIELLFSEATPSLSEGKWLKLLHEVPQTEAWVRWSAVVLGGIAIMLALTIWALAYLPAGFLERFGIPIRQGEVTIAGHLFLGAILVLGLVAGRFSLTLFNDCAPYRLDAAKLGKYQVHQGKIVRFGSWFTFGGKYSRYQRIIWRLDDRQQTEGRSPFIVGTLSAWLEPGEPVHIGLDPQGQLPPIFLGVARTAPEILTRDPKPDLVTLAEAFAHHMKQSERWRGKPVPLILRR